MEVTFIMPVYNTEKYISFAIESLLSQTDGRWRLICVDDGTKDKAMDIVAMYAGKDRRISMLQQSNQGCGAARSLAISHLNTEYGAILDSDDAVSSHYVEKLLRKAEVTDADIILPNAVTFAQDRDIESLADIPYEKTHFYRNDISTNMVYRDAAEVFDMSVSWRCHGWFMAKSSLLKKYYTKENAGFHNFNSDEYMVRVLYYRANGIAFSADAFYGYRMNVNSSTRKLSYRHLLRITTERKLFEFCISENVKAKTLLEVANRYRRCIMKARGVIKRLSVEEQNRGG